MGYQLTSSTGPKDFLSKLATFAAANGWTVEYDASAGAGANGGQIALSKENCHIAIGERSSTENPINVTDSYPEPDVTRQDYRLYAALSNSINTGNQAFWNHPGSIVTTATDSDRVQLNDCGPASELHFFSNDDSIWAVLRTNGEQYTNFGFGHLDRKGMTTPKTAFVASTSHEWWEDFQTRKADLDESGHVMWIRTSAKSMQLRVVSGTVDTAYGYESGTFITDASRIHAFLFFNQRTPELPTTSNARGGVIAHYGQVRNTPTTGGVALMSVPIFFKVNTNSDSAHTYLGDLPQVRLCDVTDVSIAEALLYGTDEYLPFPVKRRAPWGSSYIGQPSTYGLGVAFLKEE